MSLSFPSRFGWEYSLNFDITSPSTQAMSCTRAFGFVDVFDLTINISFFIAAQTREDAYYPVRIWFVLSMS